MPIVSGHEYFAYITGLNLYEEIQAISSVRFCGDLLDSLLLSFKEAKVIRVICPIFV